jgi:hypothetical protein
MAIVGIFLGGTVAVSSTGVLTMGASVQMVDSELGDVGQRNIPATDPATIAQVNATLQSMMPQLSIDAGFPVTMPVVTPSE